MLRKRHTQTFGMLALSAAFLFVGAAGVFANDYYVDPVNGNNANAGTSPGSAWKTVTFALANVPANPPHTIHLAPAIYNVSGGEVFPWNLKPSIQIVGDAGSAFTIVNGGNATDSIIRGDSYFFSPTNTAPPLPPDTTVTGLTLRQAARGIRLFANLNAIQAEFTDIVIENMTVEGVTMESFTIGGTGSQGGSVKPAFYKSRIVNCPIGMNIFGQFGTSLNLYDSVIENNTGDGITGSFLNAGNSLVLVRTRIRSNGGTGCKMDVSSSAGLNTFGKLQFVLVDSLVARNQFGIAVVSGGLFSSADSMIQRCTIVNNTLRGYQLVPGSSTAGILEASILHGNSDDLLLSSPGSVSVVNCEIGNGDFAGTNGNFSADPQFVDTGVDDYRLRFGSPCVDVISGFSTAGFTDLNGTLRNVDGNLDTTEAGDVGCFELVEVDYHGPAKIGSTFNMEQFGIQGNVCILYTSGQSLLSSPNVTAFGEFDLAPGYVPLGRARTFPGPAGIYQVTIPNNPLLVGTYFSVQGIYSSPAAPLGIAYGNAISIPITQ